MILKHQNNVLMFPATHTDYLMQPDGVTFAPSIGEEKRPEYESYRVHDRFIALMLGVSVVQHDTMNAQWNSRKRDCYHYTFASPDNALHDIEPYHWIEKYLNAVQDWTMYASTTNLESAFLYDTATQYMKSNDDKRFVVTVPNQNYETKKNIKIKCMCFSINMTPKNTTCY